MFNDDRTAVLACLIGCAAIVITLLGKLLT